MSQSPPSSTHKKKLHHHVKHHAHHLWGTFAFVGGILLITAIGLAFDVAKLRTPTRPQPDSTTSLHDQLEKSINNLNAVVNDLEDSQTRAGVRVVDPAVVQADIANVYLDLASNDLKLTRADLAKLKSDIKNWQQALKVVLRDKPELTGSGLTVPILLFHYAPNDFDHQLDELARKGYATINFDQLITGFADPHTLPAKPVIITFDDGFANQMTAFASLQKHNMKATYYIIVGGSASKYCIGAGRHYDQSPACGDAYMTWDQVRTLDKSGLITIAAHTVDHLSLASQTPEVQRYQIFTGKSQLEAQIGHAVLDFAYPYGSFNATTIELVKEAGFRSAVSTLPGTVHTLDTLFNLHRVRSIDKLP